MANPESGNDEVDKADATEIEKLILKFPTGFSTPVLPERLNNIAYCGSVVIVMSRSTTNIPAIACCGLIRGMVLVHHFTLPRWSQKNQANLLAGSEIQDNSAAAVDCVRAVESLGFMYQVQNLN
jgi:2-keto-4-pentenoate hydratase/2-oxohepta-3-ene-1,7-dioic acid hydratase in catechol pathway